MIINIIVIITTYLDWVTPRFSQDLLERLLGLWGLNIILRMSSRKLSRAVLLRKSWLRLCFGLVVGTKGVFPRKNQSCTQSNACARVRMALALGKLNFSCAVIGLTFINRTCRQRTGTPKFRCSGCQFLQSQCHPSPRTGIALGTRLRKKLIKLAAKYAEL